MTILDSFGIQINKTEWLNPINNGLARFPFFPFTTAADADRAKPNTKTTNSAPATVQKYDPKKHFINTNFLQETENNAIEET